MSISNRDDGHQVRVMRQGRTYTKFFSFRDHGKRAALRKARAYERALLERLPPPTTCAGRRKPVRTNTGRRYISRSIAASGLPCFRIKFRSASGHWDETSVSIAKHGVRRGMQLAREAFQRLHVPPENTTPAVKLPTPAAMRDMLQHLE